MAEGATLELDGRGMQVRGYEKGNFIGPTILSGDHTHGVRAEMEIDRQEIIGPVLLALALDLLEESTALVSANPFGNGVGLFTRSGAATRWFQEEIDVGQVGINMPIPVPDPYLSFTDSRGFRLGDLGPYDKQVVQFDMWTKTVTARSLDDAISMR